MWFQHTLLPKCYQKDWLDFIGNNYSVIRKFFYGMASTWLKCRECGLENQKMTIYVYFIANPKWRVISSVTLIFQDERIPLKILVSLKFTFTDLNDHVRQKYNILNEFMVVEYKVNISQELVYDTISK